MTTSQLEDKITKCEESVRRKILDMYLSKHDIAILRMMLQSKGRISTLEIAKQINRPSSSVQRRRKFLEENLVTYYAELNAKPFKYKEVQVDVSLSNTTAVQVIAKLEANSNIVKIARGFGSKGIDLRLTCYIRENHELVDLCDKIKAMEGVSGVGFFELTEEYRPNELLTLIFPHANLMTVSDLEDVEQSQGD